MIHEKAITLKQLRALTAIVKAGNLTAAAEALNVTPPAVSTQLRLLEANLGVALLYRGPDGKTVLTESGAVVLAATRQIENSLSGCYKNINALKTGKVGHVTLGVVSTAKYFAPRIVVAAKKGLPDVDISLFVGNRAEIIEAFFDKKVDLAIMGRPPRNPPVEAEPLGENPHILVAPAGHPLATKRDISPDDLLKETFLARERGSGTRILMQRFLDRIGEGQEYKTMVIDSNETIKQSAIAGLGLAFISGQAVSAELSAGRLVNISYPGLPIVRHWFLIRLAGGKLSPVAKTFAEFLIGLEGSYLPDTG
ncbi:MAG: LysR family transcriptional regulator [Rhodobacteraceae bacterium]|nr:LysR family transcriptional regulator [Paracoccaceae bacterium]